MQAKPLDDLELFELFRVAYPERFKDDEDATWDAAMDFTEELSGRDDIADLLGRVVMLSMPMRGGLTGRLVHCLGVVTIDDNKASMAAAVTRDVG